MIHKKNPPAGWFKNLLLLPLALASVAALQAQTYSTPHSTSTFAGAAGAPGYVDDTGPSSRFNNPYGVALDTSGNLHVADRVQNVIRKVTPAGVTTTLAGNASAFAGYVDGQGSVARFNSPHGVAVDVPGNVYVSDYGNQTIRKITPGGLVSTLAGAPDIVFVYADGTGTSARFNRPESLALVSAGNLFVVDSWNQRIRKVTAAGVVTTVAGNAIAGSADGTGAAASFYFPVGVAIDSSNNLYVADYTRSIIRKVTPAAVVTTIAGSAGTTGAADGLGGVARFNNPEGVAVDAAGNLYIADTGNSTIRKIAANGQVSTLAGLATTSGTTDGSGSAGRFNQPYGLAVNGSGALYIADTVNHTIRKAMVAGAKDFSADGWADIIWQNPTSGAFGFWLMNGTTFSA